VRFAGARNFGKRSESKMRVEGRSAAGSVETAATPPAAWTFAHYATGPQSKHGGETNYGRNCDVFRNGRNRPPAKERRRLAVEERDGREREYRQFRQSPSE
jgi:hypothetical protein